MSSGGLMSWLFGKAEPVEETEPPPKKDDDEPAAEAGPDPAVEAIKNVRDDLTKYGTAMGVGSVIVVGGSAVVNYDSMFPLADSRAWVAVVATFAAAIVGSVALTARFFIAKRRILIDTMEFMERRPAPSFVRTVPSRQGGMSIDERRIVERRLREFAHEEGVADVTLAEARAERLRRVAGAAAAEGEAEVAKLARTEAQRLSAGLSAAISQAALLVVERRSAAVYKSVWAITFALMAAFGAVGVFVVADWSKGEREVVEAWVQCNKDLKDEASSGLRAEVCGRLDPDPAAGSTPPSGDGEGDAGEPSADPTANTALLEMLGECASESQPAGVPDELWTQALASCAGLEVPQPSAEPTP